VTGRSRVLPVRNRNQRGRLPHPHRGQVCRPQLAPGLSASRRACTLVRTLAARGASANRHTEIRIPFRFTTLRKRHVWATRLPSGSLRSAPTHARPTKPATRGHR